MGEEREKKEEGERENGEKQFKCEIAMNSIHWAWDTGK